MPWSRGPGRLRRRAEGADDRGFPYARSAPQAATTLVAPVYGSYTTTKYSSPPYLSPGGTVYQPCSEAVYWPQGCDWGTVQYLPFVT